jgi:hypothetical protein
LQITPQGNLQASPNQYLANVVAATLNQSPALKQFRVNISAQSGIVDLQGSVMTVSQHAEVLRLVRAVPGVAQVNDRIQVAGEIVVAQAPVPLTPVEPLPPQGDKLPKVIGEPKDKKQPPMPIPFPPAPGAPGQPGVAGGLPGAPGFAPGMPGMMPPHGGNFEPLPLHGTPPGFPSATQPPPLPPYAWPSYAPYNNYSRVAYPNMYPYESFPFIGPFYPFPKVPLGWRSVTLSWEDGHWWLGRNATGYDWWRVRYW